MCTSAQKTRELVALAKDGDKPALNRLYTVYAERVRWMVRFRINRQLRSKLESMDLVHNTFVHALGGLNDFTYRNEGDFVRWLSKIAENEVRANLRGLHAQKRDIRKETPLDDDGPNTGRAFAGTAGLIRTTTPSAIMSRKDELDRLENAMDELKPEYREVIVLTKIEGLAYKEVSKKLGKSNEAVRKLVSRAMAELAIAFRGA